MVRLPTKNMPKQRAGSHRPKEAQKHSLTDFSMFKTITGQVTLSGGCGSLDLVKWVW